MICWKQLVYYEVQIFKAQMFNKHHKVHALDAADFLPPVLEADLLPRTADPFFAFDFLRNCLKVCMLILSVVFC